MIYIVDRFEEDFAVLEEVDSLLMINVKKDLLPNDIKEGSVLRFWNNNYILDNNSYDKRKYDILKKFNRLRNNIKKDL